VIPAPLICRFAKTSLDDSNNNEMKRITIYDVFKRNYT